jgi:hypothetical protein
MYVTSTATFCTSIFNSLAQGLPPQIEGLECTLPALVAKAFETDGQEPKTLDFPLAIHTEHLLFTLNAHANQEGGPHTRMAAAKATSAVR